MSGIKLPPKADRDHAERMASLARRKTFSHLSSGKAWEELKALKAQEATK